MSEPMDGEREPEHSETEPVEAEGATDEMPTVPSRPLRSWLSREGMRKVRRGGEEKPGSMLRIHCELAEAACRNEPVTTSPSGSPDTDITPSSSRIPSGASPPSRPTSLSLGVPTSGMLAMSPVG